MSESTRPPQDIDHDDGQTEPPDRLTLVLNGYHELQGERPHLIDFSESWLLTRSEQPFIRRIDLTPEWQELPLGWFSEPDVGFVVLENMPKRRNRTPTEEQRQEDEKRIIDVSFRADQLADDTIGPKMFRIYQPCVLRNLRVRSPNGPGRLCLTLISR